MIITPTLKDQILKDLVEADGITLQINLRDHAKEYGIEYTILESILDHFESLNFLEYIGKYLGGIVLIRMKVSASDFYLHGGFQAQEELLQSNIKKLLLEIEALKPSMPEKIATITSIASNIASALSLFVK
ncbi:hypothetical protein [Bacteroides graminisolvens]